MLIFVGAEVMFFAGLISAFTISQAAATSRTWGLPQGQLVPIVATAFNTMALLLSGVLVGVAGRQYDRRGSVALRTLVAGTIVGAVFVCLQGLEWAALLSNGVTLWSSKLGAFFFVIVGTHALHAVAALIGLAVACWRLRVGTLSRGFLLGAQTFWYFVVGIWPVIYARVYF
jgi:cytochrome c oxidase subunit 3